MNWPDGFDRTPPSERRAYPGGFEVTRHRSFESIMDELERIDAYNIEVETNAPHKSRRPHQPYQNADPDDPSVVVYFERDGRQFAIPCDRWDNLRDNARCIAKYLGAKRAIDRYGVATIDTEMSTQALPSGNEEEAIVAGSPDQPHEILEVDPNASDEVVRAAFAARIKEDHPDQGPDGKRTVQQLKKARDSLLSDK